MMIIRVLPIHVLPCYEGGFLEPTPLKPYTTYDDHLVWPIHVPRRCEPLITPHLSLWGNARTKATFPTHKKSHNPHPHTGEREGGQDLYITLGGVACQTWIIYIIVYNTWYTYMTIYDNKNIVYQYIISAHTWSTTSTSFFRAAPPFGRRPKNARKAHFCCQFFCTLVRGRFCFVSVLCFWACFSTSILHHVFGWDQKRHWAPGIWNA